MGRWSKEENIMFQTCPSGTFWALRESGIKTFKDLFDMTAEQYLSIKRLNDKKIFTTLRDFAIQQCKENSTKLPDWASRIMVAKNKNKAYTLYIPNEDNDIRKYMTYENALFFMKQGIDTMDKLMEIEPENIIKFQGIGKVRIISILTDICMYKNDGTTVQYYLDRINKAMHEENHKLEERKAAAYRLDELGSNIDVTIYVKEDNLYVNNYLIDLDNSIFTPREVVILKSRFIKGMTLEEISKMFNVTKERIRQVQANAVRKITKNYRRMITSLAYLSIEFNSKSVNKEMFILKEEVTNE